MERGLALEFCRVTEAAALASARWMGRGDKMAADGAAVKAMRAVFDTVAMAGTVVIGEGEMDEAPMLYIGEKVGKGVPPYLDVAVDPLEGTNLVAKGADGAIAVLAVGETGCLLHAPDMYMDKICVGPWAKGKIDIDAPVRDNLHILAACLHKSVQDLTVVIMDRDRHERIIREVRDCGARIKLITDGDVSPCISAGVENSGVDLVMGIGGAPEGVLAAAAMKCLGGEMQARLKPETEEEYRRALQMGIGSVERKLTMEDLVRGDDVIFSATGITNGELLKGVNFTDQGAKTSTLVMRSKTGTIRFVEATHVFAKKPLIESFDCQ